MPEYLFTHMTALDETGEGPARQAEGQVYEVADTTFTTPLPITDPSGSPLSALTSSSMGIVPAFRAVASQPRVVWRSGPYTQDILSNDGVMAELAAAKDSAQRAADAAQLAQEQVESIVEDVVAPDLTGVVIRLVYSGGTYPSKTGPSGARYEFIGPANPETLGLMADGDNWIEVA
ncbi:hypothetical protein N866_07245 [Actinotalea ferrariae CF5-4]|uniref:Uncharacterized protein n=1 Tax=Actinotalea ferrariae CF5-4 TaxID=948458 RepID=A0A021VXD2_9CELL|nr:hypothetical protein [Actinotalea ferrariae]EYR64685.1 hypothetical protein N866_07245 [Actinotalea ferrariae CF5-4]